MGIQRVVCMFCFGDACDVFVFYRMLPDSADGIAFFPLCVCVCVCVSCQIKQYMGMPLLHTS
jgi:hypothetical protein